MDLRLLLAALSTSLGVDDIVDAVDVVDIDGVTDDAKLAGVGVGGVLGVGTEDDTGAGLGDLRSVSAPALRDAWIKTSRSLWLMSGDISMALTVAWSWDTSWLWARDSLDL